MTVAIIGGIKKLEKHYPAIAREYGIKPRPFNAYKGDLTKRIQKVDGIILFTNCVSHQAAKKVYKLARAKNKCLICQDNCSLTATEQCFRLLQSGHKKFIKHAT